MIKSKLASTLFSSFKSTKIYFVSIFVSLFLWQCISAPDFLGGDLLPDNDFSQVKIDTSFKLSAFTQAYDSINTAGFSEGIVGETYDAVFGKTRSSFLSQLLLGTLKDSFGTNPIVDSAFLYLSLSHRLGNAPIQFSVYELTKALSLDSAYNGLAPNDHFISQTEIGSTTIPYSGEESILKIPISKDWVSERLIIPAGINDSIFISQPNFLKHMHGICVAPKSTFASYAKGMYAFNNLSTESKLVIYYKNDEVAGDTINEFYKFSLVFSPYNARFNHFSHDYSLADPSLALHFTTPTLPQDSVFYVKGLGSVRSEIFLDDVASWIDSMPVSINRAELRIELEDYSLMPADTLMNTLLLYTIVNNQRINLVDRSINEVNFGGNYSKSKRYYSFNITYHLQSLLNNPNLNRSIFIEPRYAFQSAESAVLRSHKHSKPMKLIITYTKL